MIMKRKMYQPMTGYSITTVRSKDKKGMNSFILLVQSLEVFLWG